MASYDLSCTSCGSDFELFVQGFLKDEQRVCPSCGSTEIEQRFTGFLCGAGTRSSSSSSSSGCGSSGFS